MCGVHFEVMSLIEGRQPLQLRYLRGYVFEVISILNENLQSWLLNKPMKVAKLEKLSVVT